MELYLVRHTTPEVAAGVCYGSSEIDVCADFAQEAAAVRAKLAGLESVALYTSPQLRCRKLAAVLALGEAQADDRLRELHFGAWEMQPWEAIPRAALDHWGSRFVEQAPPGGESFNELYRRATAFFIECAARHHGPVVAVTHAGVIRSLLAHALEVPLMRAPDFHLDFGGLTKLTVSGPYIKVAYVNR